MKTTFHDFHGNVLAKKLVAGPKRPIVAKPTLTQRGEHPNGREQRHMRAMMRFGFLRAPSTKPARKCVLKRLNEGRPKWSRIVSAPQPRKAAS